MSCDIDPSYPTDNGATFAALISLAFLHQAKACLKKKEKEDMFPFGGYIINEAYAGFFLAGKKSTKGLHFLSLFCSLNRKVGEIPANNISDGKRTGERRSFFRLSWSVCCPLKPLS